MGDNGSNDVAVGEKMTNREAAIKVIRQLRRSGFEALLAGGCVRDMLLGRRAKDFDIATGAHPKEVMKIFRRTVKVGVKFGVVIVLLGKKQVEVATFRTETGYVDGRHPGKVEFSDAREDALRRDFTINGMFYDPIRREVIDYVGGRGDLEKKLIRTIGVARERFGEDYLRMLRAVRFSAQLGFAIESKTKSAIGKGAKNISKMSGERIAMELEGILAGANRSAGASLLIRSGLAGVIFPGFAGKGAAQAVKVLAELPKRIDFALGLAGFFAGFETGFAIEKCRVLKPSRNLTKQMKFLLANRSVLLDDEMSLADLRVLLAEPCFEDLYALEKAIQRIAGGGKALTPLLRIRRRINSLGDIELRPKPLLDGYYLIRLGAVPGPMVGQLGREMYIAQLQGGIESVPEAREWVKEWLDKHKEMER